MSELTKPEDLTENSSLEEVGEAAYYAACISDPTYHGTDFNRASQVCVMWAKWTDSPVDNYGKAHDAFEEKRNEKKASA